MKSILISLFLMAATTLQAQNSQDVRFDGAGSPPIFANLTIDAITRNMTAVNPRIRLVSGASVSFNNKTLQLTFNRTMPQCAPNMMCIQVMPAPININLSVVKIENTPCAVKYIAVTPAHVMSLIQEQVIIQDYTFSKCKILRLGAGAVTYSATGISSLSKQQETATATFTAVEFIRAVN